jgi:hypothetical protein
MLLPCVKSFTALCFHLFVILKGAKIDPMFMKNNIRSSENSPLFQDLMFYYLVYHQSVIYNLTQLNSGPTISAHIFKK